MSIVELFRSVVYPPSDLVIAARRLEEHKRNLISAKEARSYADKMVLHHLEQIEQLTEHLQAERNDNNSQASTKLA